MKLHRFYVGGLHDKRGQLQLEHRVWVHDANLLNQWLKVLRFRVNDELVLFDGDSEDHLYKITTIEPQSVGLDIVTTFPPKHPSRHVYLFWSLLKSDKNDLVLQKCTELGVGNFVPIIAERTEKTGFDEARSRRIIIEAVEQCGRSDIPELREPVPLHEVLDEYGDKIALYVCEQGSAPFSVPKEDKPLGVLIGPEGGWSEAELASFKDRNLPHIDLNDFTLRAETASISAITKLML